MYLMIFLLSLKIHYSDRVMQCKILFHWLQKITLIITISKYITPVVSLLDSQSRGPGYAHGQGRCVVFLGKTLYSHVVSLHPGVYIR